MRFVRRFTTAGTSPYNLLEWASCRSEIQKLPMKIEDELTSVCGCNSAFSCTDPSESIAMAERITSFSSILLMLGIQIRNNRWRCMEWRSPVRHTVYDGTCDQDRAAIFGSMFEAEDALRDVEAALGNAELVRFPIQANENGLEIRSVMLPGTQRYPSIEILFVDGGDCVVWVGIRLLAPMG